MNQTHDVERGDLAHAVARGAEGAQRLFVRRVSHDGSPLLPGTGALLDAGFLVRGHVIGQRSRVDARVEREASDGGQSLEGRWLTAVRTDDTTAAISSRVAGSVKRRAPPASVTDFVLGPAIPRLATTCAPCQLSVRTRSRRAKTPPLVPARADQRDRLAVELAGADDPVERVLHHAGDRAGVLGRGDHHRVRGAEPGAEVLHRLAGIVAVVGIERRNGRQILERPYNGASR